jgi:hypothetical protein
MQSTNNRESLPGKVVVTPGVYNKPIIGARDTNNTNATNSAAAGMDSDKENASSVARTSGKMARHSYEMLRETSMSKSLLDDEKEEYEDGDNNDAQDTPFLYTDSGLAQFDYGAMTTPRNRDYDTPSAMFSPASSTLATITNHNNRRTSKLAQTETLVHAGTATQAWEDFVRKGTRIKSFLDGTLYRFGQQATKREVVATLHSPESNRKESTVAHDYVRLEMMEAQYAANLAREKTSEVVQLQRVSSDALVRGCVGLVELVACCLL